MRSTGPPALRVVGFRECEYTRRAKMAADVLLHNKLVAAADAEIMETREEFHAWLAANSGSFGPEAQKHTTSPFCIEGTNFIGGCVELEELAAELLDINPADAKVLTNISRIDAKASLSRFKNLVKAKPFTIWIFWRGLW